MTAIPVILRSEPVSRVDPAARRARQPNVAVVYVTGEGAVEVIDGGKPMRLADQVAGRYRYRYEVDMSDHHRTVELRTSPPPAQGGFHHFTAVVNIGFRVIDPAQVVRRNVRDALRVVSDHLMFEFRKITVNFPIDAAKQAEDAVNAKFAHGTTIEGCIEIYLCRARLSPDPAAAEYLRAEQAARERNRVRTAEHELESEEVRRDNRLGLLRQHGELERREREREALAGRPFDMQDMLALHLERNPADTEKVLQIAAELQERQLDRADAADQRGWKKFEFLANQKLVQAVDVDQVRDQVVSDLSAQLMPLPAGAAARSWDEPLPGDAEPATEPDSAALPGLIPVYLVVDESSAVASGIEALNAGMRALYDAVASQPAIAQVVRLAVLTYADGAVVRAALQRVRPGTSVPPFAPSARLARLAAAFERLLDCVPRDAEALKAECPSLRRPQVLLLSGGHLTDTEEWTAAHRALVDRGSQRYAPEVIAFGVGAADPDTILSLATRPEQAFVAQDRDVGSAVDRFCSFAQRLIVEYGRAVLDGDQSQILASPDGFRLAAEPRTSPMQED